MELEIRSFNVREADWSSEGNMLSNIRRLVFVVEQNVPAEEEWDGMDDDSWHFLATDQDDVPIGTARLLADGQIGRMAVLGKYRGAGIGSVLLETAVDKARHLGFDHVFLHAQTHALDFYLKAGFIAEGEEFEEAGIAHVNMRMDLSPLDDNVQRRQAVVTHVDINVKKFDTRTVSWNRYGKLIRVLRQTVLVGELQLPGSFVEDDIDPKAIHWVAEDASGQVIGSIRMMPSGEVSRLVVAPEHRHNGIGLSLLELSVAMGYRFALDAISTEALDELAPIYFHAGFQTVGDSYRKFGLAHQRYNKTLDHDDEDIERSKLVGVELGDSIYRLGQDKQFILLRREEDFRNVITEMCRQATQSIRIYSPLLEHKLFDNQELREICSALARRNKYTFIEILLYDSHRVVKNGHALLEISRKLSSSIRLKIVHPEYRQLNQEFVLVDGVGVIYRHDHEEYDGYANFLHTTECNRLARQFSRAWESGLFDPNLRTLRI